MSTQRALGVAGAAAYHLLKVAHESSDVLPPLKRVVGGALYITDLVVKFRTRKQEWQEFNAHVGEIVRSIVESLKLVDVEQIEIRDKLKEFQSVLDGIAQTIKAKQSEGFGKQILHFMEHPEMIAELRKRVDDAVDRLKLDSVVKTEIKVDKTLKLAENNSQQLSKAALKVDETLKLAENNSRQLSKAALDAVQTKLRHVRGASWDSNRVCLEHTRKHVIEDIISWVDNASDSRTENILLLTGVAGAGKSTVAHTISRHYHTSRQLVTSFFFDRETDKRNNPERLIGTIAADLCQTNERLANQIMHILEEDVGIASAPISRQFDELVLKPCGNLAPEHPLVIVLDALDEGYNDDLLTILSEKVPLLPRRVCFVVTARTLPKLDALCRQPHVHELELNIHTPDSINDVALFVSHRLKKVAEYHRLGEHWPGHELVDLFNAMAEGLFIWVATICDYLLDRSNPTNELRKLVSTSHKTNVSAESKMDKLYTTILETFAWDDDDFVEDYRRLMGAAVASKTPLTLGALASLYQLMPVISNLTRRQLSPLLTGLGNDSDTATQQPVRFLHQSLPDFLIQRVSRSSSLVDNREFAIDERAHSQTLAILCLKQMNRELNGSIPGIGYLTGGASMPPGIPSPNREISEALWYACRFWMDHLLDIDLPLSPPIRKELEEFLGARLVLWMELMAGHGRYEGLSKLQIWVKEQYMQQTPCTSLVFNESQGSALRSLARRLDYMGRLEEALTAAREGVEVYKNLMEHTSSESRKGLSEALNTLSTRLYKLGYYEDALKVVEEAVELGRQLAIEQPTACTPGLALSFNELSLVLSNLGRHEEALKATEEAVKLRRELAREQPEEFTAALATSVHNLSIRLASFGRHEEALEAIEEAVKLRRQLASERPAAFTSDLAYSVHSLSIRLASFGRHEEALEATEEAVKLRRQLASERPAAFTSDLAHSVHALSVCLSNLGRHKEALEATEEAVKLRRQLASERPAAFTSDLARSVHSLSICLASLGRHEEALEAIEEAVKLRRQLASERPAAFTSDLAYSVHELSIRLASFGRHEEALEAIEEAVKLRRQLASERPAVFTSDLVHSVHQLSVCLYNLGRHEEVLKASEEAVELGRQLAGERPAAFTPDLASLLHALAIYYSNRSRHQKALATIKESAELYRPFAEKYPARYGTEYSNALRLFEKYSAKAGTEKEAPAASAEPNAAASAE